MRFLLVLAFVALAAAATLKRGKQISIAGDGTILVSSATGSQMVISILPAQKVIDIVVNGLKVPTRIYQVNNQLTGQGGRTQGQILMEIIEQYEGTVDESQYESLLSKVNQAVQKGQISPIVSKLLQALSVEDTIVLNSIQSQIIQQQQQQLQQSQGTYQSVLEPEQELTGDIGGVVIGKQQFPISLWYKVYLQQLQQQRQRQLQQLVQQQLQRQLQQQLQLQQLQQQQELQEQLQLQPQYQPQQEAIQKLLQQQQQIGRSPWTQAGIIVSPLTQQQKMNEIELESQQFTRIPLTRSNPLVQYLLGLRQMPSQRQVGQPEVERVVSVVKEGYNLFGGNSVGYGVPVFGGVPTTRTVSTGRTVPFKTGYKTAISGGFTTDLEQPIILQEVVY